MYQDPTSVFAYLAVAGAGIVAAAIGFLWYNPRVFGTIRERHLHLTPEMRKEGMRLMPRYALVSLVASMVIAYIMLWFGDVWSVFDWQTALEFAFTCWLGFAVPLLLNAVLWEQKSFRMYVIDALYWLVAMMVMSLVLLL